MKGFKKFQITPRKKQIMEVRIMKLLKGLVFLTLVVILFTLLGCGGDAGPVGGGTQPGPKIEWTSSPIGIYEYLSPISGFYNVSLKFKNSGNAGETEFKVTLNVEGKIQEKSKKVYVETGKEYTLSFSIFVYAPSGSWYVNYPIIISSIHAQSEVNWSISLSRVDKYSSSLSLGSIEVKEYVPPPEWIKATVSVNPSPGSTIKPGDKIEATLNYELIDTSYIDTQKIHKKNSVFT